MSEIKPSGYFYYLTHPLQLFWGRKAMKMDAEKVLSASQLPDEAQQVVRDVLKRTKLWQSEKGEVAVELSAHFQDGLEAGRSMDELVKTFGKPKTVAKLIRRAKKRNRPIWWRFCLRALQGICIFAGFYVGCAIVLARRHPSPSVDYFAELNNRSVKADLSDQAWPIYHEVWTKYKIMDINDTDWWIKHPANDKLQYKMNSLCPDLVQYLQSHRDFIQSLRKAGEKPAFGWNYSAENSFTDEDCLALGITKPAIVNPASASYFLQSLVNMKMPFLSPFRQSAILLTWDMRQAASEGDTARIISDYRSILGIARQCDSTPILINELVAMGIISLADRTLCEIIFDYPDAFKDQYIDLLHEMSSIDSLFEFDLAGEKMLLMDMIQRVYSDNGSGDGSLTVDGLEALSAVSQLITTANATPSDEMDRMLKVFSLPLASAIAPTRKQLTDKANQIYTAAATDAQRPMWVKIHEDGESLQLVKQANSSTIDRIRYALPLLVIPSLYKASIGMDESKAYHHATMTAVALEGFRARNGQYPTTLAELSPHYLQAMPLDYSTGKPLVYKLVSGKPLLYGLGKDGIDDGGVWLDDPERYPRLPEKGDWVLYPPVINPKE